MSDFEWDCLDASEAVAQMREPKRLHVKSSELRTGDIVYCHGMRVLLDRPINSRTHGYLYNDMPVYYSRGKVLNRAEVSPDSVPLGFTYYEDESDPRWAVQGNDNAWWSIDR